MAINKITAAMLGTTNAEQNKNVLATDGSGNLYWTQVQTNAADIPLNWPDDSTIFPTGAINNWSEFTTVATAIDDLNELAVNMMNNTAVANVDFTADITSGGAGSSVTLTITADGNPTRYTIDWGDGNTTAGTADSTPTHIYSSNVGSPFDVVVTAYNHSGTGAGSSVSKTRTNYITIYTATPVVAYDFYRASSGGSALSGNDLYVVEGDSLYMDNNTTNIGAATVDYSISWGDGTPDSNIASDSSAGGTAGTRLQHTWAVGTSSGTSLDTTQLTLNNHSTAAPGDIPTSTTKSLKVYDSTPSAPNGLSSKTISFSGSTGTNPRLASGFTDNTSGATYVAGDDVNRTTATSGTIDSSTLTTYAYNAAAGVLSAVINGSTNGSRTMTGSGDTGTYTSLVITAESDYQLLTSSGSSTTFASSTYYPGAYTGFKAKVAAAASGISVGVNDFKLSHSTTGDTNVIEFVKDSLTATPTVSVSGATLTENTAGTYRYVSGIPYYNSGSPNLTLSGVTVTNLVGQCYTNQSNIVEVDDGTNQEGTSSDAITSSDYTYANIDGASTMLSGGIPVVNIGTSSAYSIGNLTVPITSSSVRTVSRIKVRARNVNGIGSYSSDIATNIAVHKSAQSGISEIAIAVSDSLGNGTYLDDGIRIFDFSAETTDTPAVSDLTNYYTNNVYLESSDPGVAGTKEATVRLGVLKHDVTDYSTGYLPVGPDRSADTGTQYFTFAFRRQAVANFDINITSSSGISGLWIAAPGTAIDSASTLNGWLDASVQYAGSGVPGADTGNSGNGSNGCAFTGSDKILTSTSLSGSYTMTLGTENMSNATGNVVLVRIALASGESVTALSIGVAS